MNRRAALHLAGNVALICVWAALAGGILFSVMWIAGGGHG